MLNPTINPPLALRAAAQAASSGAEQAAASTVTVVTVASDLARSLDPYREARREWNERYREYVQQARQWRTVALASALVMLAAWGGVFHIGAQRRFVPYTLRVSKLEPVDSAAPKHDAGVDPRIIKAYLARFVMDWRSVTVDRQAQKTALDRVYVMLPQGSVALSKMDEFFKARNPFNFAADGSVDVSILNVSPVSDRTWQVQWQEVTRNLLGTPQNSVRMKVSLIVGNTPPTQENLIVVNPLGVYITDLNWSRQL